MFVIFCDFGEVEMLFSFFFKLNHVSLLFQKINRE